MCFPSPRRELGRSYSFFLCIYPFRCAGAARKMDIWRWLWLERREVGGTNCSSHPVAQNFPQDLNGNVLEIKCHKERSWFSARKSLHNNVQSGTNVFFFRGWLAPLFYPRVLVIPGPISPYCGLCKPHPNTEVRKRGKKPRLSRNDDKTIQRKAG